MKTNLPSDEKVQNTPVQTKTFHFIRKKYPLLIFLLFIPIIIILFLKVLSGIGVMKYYSCQDLLFKKDGIYTIYPDRKNPVYARCRFEKNTAWTIIDFSLDKNWISYFYEPRYDEQRKGYLLPTSCYSWDEWFTASSPKMRFSTSADCRTISAENKVYRATGNFYGCLWYAGNDPKNFYYNGPYDFYRVASSASRYVSDTGQCWSCQGDWWNTAPSIGTDGTHCIAYTNYLPDGSNRKKPVIAEVSPTPQSQIHSNWEEYSNTNGYSLSYPSSMKIVIVGFGDQGLESSPSIYILKNGGNETNQPHVYINSIGKKNQTLEQAAKQNYDANLNHTYAQAEMIEPLHKSVLNGISTFAYAIKSKGFQGPLAGYAGFEGVYKVVWLGNNTNYIMAAWNDALELNQLVATLRVNDITD